MPPPKHDAHEAAAQAIAGYLRRVSVMTLTGWNWYWWVGAHLSACLEARDIG